MTDRTIAPSRPHTVRRLAFPAIMAAFLAACTGNLSPPPHLYVLDPIGLDKPTRATVPNGRLVVIGVAPTLVPEYLDRPQIIERTGASELKLVETDQWAERLSVNISRVLAENLSVLLPADAALQAPARSGLSPDYQVLLELDRFELDDSGNVVVAGRWSVSDGDGSRELLGAPVLLRTPVAQPADAKTIVAAMSQSLASVSREIAKAIQQLPPGTRTK